MSLTNKNLNEMNHDITHCDGANCQMKGSCRRYQAHRDLPTAGMGAEPVSYIDAWDCTSDGYSMYWEEVLA